MQGTSWAGQGGGSRDFCAAGRARSREGRAGRWLQGTSTRPTGPAPLSGSCRAEPVKARLAHPLQGWKGSPPPEIFNYDENQTSKHPNCILSDLFLSSCLMRLFPSKSENLPQGDSKGPHVALAGVHILPSREIEEKTQSNRLS